MRHWQLMIAAVWIALGLSLIFRDTLGIRFANYGEKQMTLVIVVAFAMAGWNIVRWHFGKLPAPAVEPLIPPREAPPYEYNPDLDFQKMERDQPKGG